jgi:hypothetical protein
MRSISISIPRFFPAAATRHSDQTAASHALQFGGLVNDIIEKKHPESLGNNQPKQEVKKNYKNECNQVLCRRGGKKITIAHVLQAMIEKPHTFQSISKGLKLNAKQQAQLEHSLKALQGMNIADTGEKALCCDHRGVYAPSYPSGTDLFKEVYPALPLPEIGYVYNKMHDLVWYISL